MSQPAFIILLLMISTIATENSQCSEVEDTNDSDDLHLLQTRVQLPSSIAGSLPPTQEDIVPAKSPANLPQVADSRSKKPRRGKSKSDKDTKLNKRRVKGESDLGRATTIHAGTKGEEYYFFGASLLLVVSLYLYTVCCNYTTAQTISEPEKDQMTEPLDEDTTGFFVYTLINDAHVLVKWDSAVAENFVRLLQALGFFLFTKAVQITILYFIKEFCVAEAVYDARTAYSAYELAMVGNNVEFTTMTVYGEYRAMAEHFDPAFFAPLDDMTKKKVCNIPFSQPVCLQLVILLWTFTCCLDYRRCLDYYFALIVATPTIDSMSDAVKEEDCDEPEKKMLVGITPMFKHVIYLIVLVPRFLVACVLMWLGCRWLAATTDFADLVLNACALELICGLKGLFYSAMVSTKTKIEIQKAEIFTPAYRRKGWLSHTSGLAWGLLACAWTYYYIHHFQSVLLGYRFDVASLCIEWISERYGWV